MTNPADLYRCSCVFEYTYPDFVEVEGTQFRKLTPDWDTDNQGTSYFHGWVYVEDAPQGYRGRILYVSDHQTNITFNRLIDHIGSTER